MALLIPFAVRLPDRRVVAPDEVERGLACGCVCPGCGEPVVARQGEEKRWHFAHAQESGCLAGYRAAVVAAAQQQIQDNPWLQTQARSVSQAAVTAFGDRHHETEIAIAAGEVALEQLVPADGPYGAELEAKLEGQAVRVLILTSDAPSPDTIQSWQADGSRVLAVDLSGLANEQVDRDVLELALFGHQAPARWLSHPEIDAAKTRAYERLRDHLAKEEARHAEWRRMTYAERAEAQRRAERAKLVDFLSAAERTHSWRASLPDRAHVNTVLEDFAATHRLDSFELFSRFDQIKSRGWLAKIAPADLVDRWAHELSVSRSDFLLLLHDAGYIL